MYLKHFLQTLRHKWYVLYAGIRLKAPLWRLLLHDLSKFRPSEFGPYARQFHGGGDIDFPHAWLLHQNRNKHHWEFWVGRSSHTKGPDDTSVIPMPRDVVREMVADWLAAGKVYEGKWPDLNNYTWLKENWYRMRFAFLTKLRIEDTLDEARRLKW